MIAYNAKEWFTFIFRFHKADTLRRLLPLLLAICIYSGLVAFLELKYLKLSSDSYIKNISIIHSLLGFVISLLLVFRTNTAYDRWWEGRKLWGSLVNNSRNLAIKLNSMLDKTDYTNRKFFHNTISLYASALSRHLRSESTRLALDEEYPDFSFDKTKHIPNQIACNLMNRIHQIYKDGVIKGDQLIFLNAEIQSFTDICGACERIKNTPIPFSYSVFLKKFVFFYVMTIPLSFVFSLGYWVIPVSAFILYVLAGLELIAEEIEDPFGEDTNDLPTEKIANNISKHIGEILLEF